MCRTRRYERKGYAGQFRGICVFGVHDDAAFGGVCGVRCLWGKLLRLCGYVSNSRFVLVAIPSRTLIPL
jgi:hypothetical protein